MGSVKIITDSTCDVPDYLLKQYEITVVPLLIQIGEATYLDRRELGSQELFRRLPLATLATTLPPTLDSFEQAYRAINRAGDSALVITLSSKLSDTYQTAMRARESVGGRTAANIAVIDSLSTSMGLGLMVLAAAKAAARGNLGLSELTAFVTRMVGQTHVVFFVENYEYLTRGGRAARIAPLLEQATTRYLLRLDEGQIVPFERARTRAKAIEGLYNFVEDFPHVEEMAVLHNGVPHEVEQLLTRIHPIYPRERVLVTEYSAALGTHLGPNALGPAVSEGDDH